MQNLWRTQDADAMVAHYAGRGVGQDIAECLYLTRLIGSDKRLVLHGGGNSSVKTHARDAAGIIREALCVKASGENMANLLVVTVSSRPFFRGMEFHLVDSDHKK